MSSATGSEQLVRPSLGKILSMVCARPKTSLLSQSGSRFPVSLARNSLVLTIGLSFAPM